jgi:hypothetical protein
VPEFRSISDKSVFAAYRPTIYSHNYEASIYVGRLIGGIPSKPSVVEGWIRKSLGEQSSDLLRQMVAETIQQRYGLDPANLDRPEILDKAIAEVAHKSNLNGFKRDPDRLIDPATGKPFGDGIPDYKTDGELYIEGRQVKAALKEAANIRWPWEKGKGKTFAGKGAKSFVAEHVFVLDDRCYLGVDRPDDIQERFVHANQGPGIAREEYVENVEVSFSVTSDWAFTDSEWAELWLTAELQGVGATRSQGFGRFAVTRWDRVEVKGKKK